MTKIPHTRRRTATWKRKMPRDRRKIFWVYIWRRIDKPEKGYVGMSRQDPAKYRCSIIVNKEEFDRDFKAGLLKREIVCSRLSEMRAAILENRIFEGMIIPPGGKIKEFYNAAVQRPTVVGHGEMNEINLKTAAMICRQNGIKDYYRSKKGVIKFR